MRLFGGAAYPLHLACQETDRASNTQVDEQAQRILDARNRQ